MLDKRFSDALRYAADLHRNQRRKGTEVPYVSHLLAVAGIVIEHGADEDTAIAALLHDAAEDQGGEPTLNEIRAKFGPRVAEIVAACSDSMETPKPDFEPRKRAYIASVAKKNAATLLVTIADKLHNVRAIVADYRVLGPGLWERFTGKRDGTIWYYDELRIAFRDRVPRELWNEFDRTLNTLAELMRTKGDEAKKFGAA